MGLFDNNSNLKVGDKVRIKYREQEGYIIGQDGDLFDISAKDGEYVDSFYADELELIQGSSIRRNNSNSNVDYSSHRANSSEERLNKAELISGLCKLLLGIMCLLCLPLILIFYFIVGITKNTK